MNWLSNLFKGIGAAAQGAGKSIGGAFQSVAQPISGAVGAGTKLGQNLMGQFNPTQLLGAASKIGAPKPATSPIQGSQGGGTNMFSMPLIGALGQSNPASSMPVGLGTGVSGGDMDETTDKKKKNIWEQFFPGGTTQGIAGLAAPLLGDMFSPKSPQIPDMSSLSSVQAMQNFRPGNSVSPEYQDMIQRNVQQLREQKVRELQALYHSARPGTDYLTDTNYQRDLALLDQGIQDNLADELTRAEATFSSQEQERLSQLAQMDIYSIMAQTGLEAQEAQQFKEMFSNIGNTFLTQATRNPNQYDFSSLFGGA